MINKSNTIHYKWGANCDSWIFLEKKNVSIKLESMPPDTKEISHYHSKAEQFFFILKGKASFYVENKLSVIHEQQGISILPNTTHYISNETKRHLEFLVISQPTTSQDRTDIEK